MFSDYSANLKEVLTTQRPVVSTETEYAYSSLGIGFSSFELTNQMRKKSFKAGLRLSGASLIGGYCCP